MSTFASLPDDERRVYITEVANRLGLSAVLVEKDFWVTWTLGRLFKLPDIRDGLVFKGGTSLSKVFKAIKRFSEDIDLQITPKVLGIDEASLRADSKSEQDRRVERLEERSLTYVTATLQPALEADIAAVLGDAPAGSWLQYEFDEGSKSPTLLFRYPSSIADESGYLPKTVKLEPGSLADQRPTDTHIVSALVKSETPTFFDDFVADVVALDIGRTFWEKATILHTEFHRKQDSPIRDRSARHYSDFSELWRHVDRAKAVRDLELLDSVVAMKELFFHSGWANYDTARPPTLRIAPPDYRISALASDYDRMREMFFEEPPPFDRVLETLHEAEREINA